MQRHLRKKRGMMPDMREGSPETTAAATKRVDIPETVLSLWSGQPGREWRRSFTVSLRQLLVMSRESFGRIIKTETRIPWVVCYSV